VRIAKGLHPTTNRAVRCLGAGAAGVFVLQSHSPTPADQHEHGQLDIPSVGAKTCTRHPARRFAPHLHCLRHSFAVGTLLHWYPTGIDPSRRLIHLSTFMGHVCPSSTAVYLTITPELRSFFEDYLICQKGLSTATIKSYRDGLRLFDTLQKTAAVVLPA
jgi:hypothetical protein